MTNQQALDILLDFIAEKTLSTELQLESLKYSQNTWNYHQPNNPIGIDNAKVLFDDEFTREIAKNNTYAEIERLFDKLIKNIISDQINQCWNAFGNFCGYLPHDQWNHFEINPKNFSINLPNLKHHVITTHCFYNVSNIPDLQTNRQIILAIANSWLIQFHQQNNQTFNPKLLKNQDMTKDQWTTYQNTLKTLNINPSLNPNQ